MSIRRHLSFANVASVTALSLVLGGGVAVAAGLAPNSVGSQHIKKNAVKSSDIKKNAVKSSDIKDNTIKGKDVKESTLGTVPSVETVVADERATSAVGAVPPVTVYESAPFTITLRCVDGGGGAVQAFLEIRTSVNNSAYDAQPAASDDPDLDIFDGPQSLASTSSASADIERVAFTAVSPQDKMIQGYGYVASKLHGSPGCAAQLTFIG